MREKQTNMTVNNSEMEEKGNSCSPAASKRRSLKNKYGFNNYQRMWGIICFFHALIDDKRCSNLIKDGTEYIPISGQLSTKTLSYVVHDRKRLASNICLLHASPSVDLYHLLLSTPCKNTNPVSVICHVIQFN